MELADLDTDTTTEHQQLKSVLVKAVNNSIGNTEKVTWLALVLAEAIAAADTGATVLVHEWQQDITSNASPGVLTELSRTLSVNAMKDSATDNAKLEALLTEFDTILTA